MTTDSIIYEQPVNELVRVCLRLEYLFQQIDYLVNINHDNEIAVRHLVRAIIEILNLVDRPDLKSKFTQECHRLVNIFSKLAESPLTCPLKLAETKEELNQLLNYFVQTKGKIAQSLRDNEFIYNIRVHLNSPGGDACFDLPIFYYWLQTPLKSQLAIINDWITHFDAVRRAVTLFLKIFRHSAEPRVVTSENGYYHDTFSSQDNIQLVRIGLKKGLAVFPEISVGKHRMNVRLLIPDIDARSVQIKKNIPFELTICNI